MPFRALVDGQIVTPSEVPDRQAVQCPDCGGVLYPRDGDHRARHFYHHVDDVAKSCSSANGESETHARCTALAVATLSDQFSDAACVGAEITLDVDRTKTTPDTRRADALVEFQDSDPYFGNGLIIEVQHKHHSKDLEGTTHDYLSAGFSVAWVTPDDFDDERLQYDVVLDAFEADAGRAFSDYDYDPWEFETRVEANLDWEPPSSKCHIYDEVGEHTWERVPSYAHPNGYEYEFCPYCKSRRQYDNEIGRFVYDHEGVLAPEIRPAELRGSVIPHPEVADDFDEWNSSEHRGPATFEKCLVWGTDVDPCRGPKGIHEWDKKEVIERVGYDDRVEVMLWECRHCPVYLLTNYSCHGEIENPYILFGKPPDSEWGLSHLNGNPRVCEGVAHNENRDYDTCIDCFEYNP